MTTLREYWLIPALAFAAFGVTLMIYAGAGGNPLNRIGYAVFISGIPALLTLGIAVIARGVVEVRRWTAAAIYTGIFALVILAQGVIRQW